MGDSVHLFTQDIVVSPVEKIELNIRICVDFSTSFWYNKAGYYFYKKETINYGRKGRFH